MGRARKPGWWVSGVARVTRARGQVSQVVWSLGYLGYQGRGLGSLEVLSSLGYLGYQGQGEEPG